MVGNNLKDTQLQQIVDKTILFHDKDNNGKINFEEFCQVEVDRPGFEQMPLQYESDYTKGCGVLYCTVLPFRWWVTRTSTPRWWSRSELG